MRTHPNAPLTRLRRSLQVALKDGRVSEGEVKAIATQVRRHGVTAQERQVLSNALRRDVDAFDTQAQVRMYALGARWTEPGNDPGVMSEHLGAPYRVAFGKLFVGGVSERDVRQGATGDCYLLASAASLAHARPDLLKQLFVANRNGSVTVNFFQADELGVTQRVAVTVDRDTVKALGGPLYARALDRRELWPAILEKAYAQLGGGFDVIGRGGEMSEAVFALTGQRPADLWTSTLAPDALVALLQDATAAKRPVVAATYPDETTPGIVPAHAYSVLGVVDRGAGPLVQLRNPWGVHEPGADLGGDGVFEVSVADFQRLFPFLNA